MVETMADQRGSQGASVLQKIHSVGLEFSKWLPGYHFKQEMFVISVFFVDLFLRYGLFLDYVLYLSDPAEE